MNPMKSKILLTLIITMAVCFATAARQPSQGFRGFVDYGLDFGHTERSASAVRHTLSVVPGYQINPHIFTGGGLSLEFNRFHVALFGNVRGDWKFGRFTPFGDLRIGYTSFEGGGLYFSPAVGHRFNWGRKAGLNVGIGLKLISARINNFRSVYDEENGWYVYENTTGRQRTECTFMVRVGIDF